MTHSQDSPRPIPLVDVGREHEPIREELLRAVTRVLASGRFILGDEVATFEAATAAYLGSGHSLGTSSGSDSLLACLMALDLEPDDEVLCPAFTFIATAGGISRAGAKPVFADVSPLTLDCRREDLESRITPHTRAIVAVHLFGRCSELDPIVELANDQGLVLIEDTAQALGASSGGRKAGTRGDAGCFSFYPTKNLGGFGEGGLICTDRDDLANRLRSLRDHGQVGRYIHGEIGGNFRLDALQAALLSVKLPRLDEMNLRRGEAAKRYSDLFFDSELAAAADTDCDRAPPPILVPLGAYPEHVFHQYVIRITEVGARDRVRDVLQTAGVGTQIYYPVPLHLQPCFADLGYQGGELPNAERLSREVLALPIFPYITEEEQTRVVDLVTASLRT